MEGVVQTFKKGMKEQGKGSVETKLARFLLNYRTSPHTTTGETPSQLRSGHNFGTQIDLLKTNTAMKVEEAQERQKNQQDQHSRLRRLSVGGGVQTRNYSGNRKWTPGTIIQQTGPVSARIKLENGDIFRRYQDQLMALESQPIGELVPPSFEPELLFGNNARCASSQSCTTTVTQIE